MSALGIVYGCIIGSGPVLHKRTQEFHLHNKNTIEALPEKVNRESGLLLIRGMFTVPMYDDSGSFYRVQVIHFGGSFNHLDVYWARWLQQFEQLLQKMYWHEALAHTDLDLWGKHNYHWRADLAPMFLETPQPIQTWQFEGGERIFPESLPPLP